MTSILKITAGKFTVRLEIPLGIIRQHFNETGQIVFRLTIV